MVNLWHHRGVIPPLGHNISRQNATLSRWFSEIPMMGYVSVAWRVMKPNVDFLKLQGAWRRRVSWIACSACFFCSIIWSPAKQCDPLTAQLFATVSQVSEPFMLWAELPGFGSMGLVYLTSCFVIFHWHECRHSIHGPYGYHMDFRDTTANDWSWHYYAAGFIQIKLPFCLAR